MSYEKFKLFFSFPPMIYFVGPTVDITASNCFCWIKFIKLHFKTDSNYTHTDDIKHRVWKLPRRSQASCSLSHVRQETRSRIWSSLIKSEETHELAWTQTEQLKEESVLHTVFLRKCSNVLHDLLTLHRTSAWSTNTFCVCYTNTDSVLERKTGVMMLPDREREREH